MPPIANCVLPKNREAVHEALVPLALAFAVFISVSQAAWAWAPPGDVRANDLVGKQVIQKSFTFTLKNDGRAIDENKHEIQIFYVEKADKDGQLLLRGQNNGVTGTASASELVPIDQASAFFTEQIRKNPNDDFLYYARSGIRSIIERDLDGALADIDRAIQLRPSAIAYSLRADIRLGKKQYAEAVADYDRAIEIDPKVAYTFKNRGLARLRMKDYDKAIADLTQSIRLDPKQAEAFSYRGIAWRFKKEFTKSIADYNEAMSLGPAAPGLYSIRGNTFRLNGDYHKAVADFDAAIRLEPENASNHFFRALTFFLQGRNADAAAGMKEALTRGDWKDPRSAYSAIIGSIAARRADKLKDSRTFLDDFKANGTTSDWPYPVIRYLRGEIESGAMMTAATDNDKRCEAHCYLGLDLLIRKKTAGVKDHFLWIKDRGNPEFVEYDIARAELDRMKSPRSHSKKH